MGEEIKNRVEFKYKISSILIDIYQEMQSDN